MTDKPKDIRDQLVLLRGGKSDEALPEPAREFAVLGIVTEDDSIDFSSFKIDPSLYGKTVNGVTYGDPTKEPQLLYIDDNGKPVFDFS